MGKEYIERKKKEGRGKGEEEIRGGQKKEGKKRNSSRGVRGGGKKKKGKKKSSSPQNRTRVPLMNGHNDRSCANLG